MTIRFAAAIGTAHAPVCRPIARGLVQRARERAANDNPGGIASGRGSPLRRAIRPPSEAVMRAALRHFAKHGLGAARAARAQAEAALLEGDKQAFDWWLEITRTLDRRLAAEAERLAAPSAP
jgi:hypothetical protein